MHTWCHNDYLQASWVTGELTANTPANWEQVNARSLAIPNATGPTTVTGGENDFCWLKFDFENGFVTQDNQIPL